MAFEERTIILYESPKKVLKTLSNLYEVLGDRQVCLARELTKKFEQIYRGSLAELCSADNIIKQKGEFVIIVDRNKDREYV